MKALQTIGWEKALRFLWYSFYEGLLHMSLPPIRVALLRLAGAHIGQDSVVLNADFINLYHYGFRRLYIGDRCFIGDRAMLDVRGGIHLEDDVTLSNNVSVVSHINVGFSDHPLQKQYPVKESRVVLKRGVYVGTGATILPGVTVGASAVVAAGAVVTTSVPDHVMVAGVPAKVKKRLAS